MDAHNLRELVLNAREPIVLRNFQNSWRCFNGTLYDWCAHFDDANINGKSKILFERVPVSCGSTPQWERRRQRMIFSATQLLETHQKQQNFWTGMNYIRGKDLPLACTMGIDFGQLGFPESNDDCTFWLTSPAANTPCHYDTYGCNIVKQVYGSKSWLLFPPSTPLSCTRIPYEESSVYCLENFYAPNPQELENFDLVQNCAYRVILQPNDVLIVPHQWWHFVETLELSLSINSWIPLQQDTDVQLEECIVKFLMERFIVQATPAVLNYVLNPNQLQKDVDDDELFMLAEHLLKRREKTEIPAFPYQYLTAEVTEQLVNKLPQTEKVPKISKEHFRAIMMQNSDRFNPFNEVDLPVLNVMHETLINSICAPNSIKSIKNELIKRFKI